VSARPARPATNPEMPRVEIVPLADPRWVRLARSHPRALPFHQPGWIDLLRECYGLRGFALVALGADGSARAGLPVIEVRDPLRRRRWISLPFTDHCPLLSDSGACDDALLETLTQAALSDGVAGVELRTALPGAPFSERTAGVLHELELERDHGAVYRHFHKSRVRASIRRGERGGVVVRAADCQRDLGDVYFRLHLRTRRRLGVPAQPRGFFRLLWPRVIEAGLGFVLLAEAGGATVAGAVFLHWNGHLIYKFAASDERFRSLQPNHAVLWEAIRWGCDRGYRVLDLGRSGLNDSGLRAFKHGWGAEESLLRYATLVGPHRRSDRAPAGAALRPVLRRCPLWVCRGVGAALYRYAA
jgi:CelD/BcsL family acetyltransferase involved in cellulose biosynthesis